ncbi:MAG: hypothetical protein NUV91_09255 [Candidatus Omnitrophica bacterium]|nr:hypothetical protein [Candidatus Omnitrophota bacterium]
MGAVLVFMGCSTIQPSPSHSLPAASAQNSHSAQSSTDPNAPSTPTPDVIAVPRGVIFAKTDFEGVLKTDYVDLSIVDLKDEEKIFHLRIGDPTILQKNSEETPMISPGYFSLELPAGAYAFRMISIPVGTGFASEPMRVVFEVFPDQLAYLGTLKIVGTKEKIKLGGVPVIQPGFEYTVDVLNEREEANLKIKNFFPDYQQPLSVRLMRIKSPDEDLFPSLVSPEILQKEKMISTD